MDLMQSINVSVGGMYAQSQRMKVAAENIANADSVISESGGAYRRQQLYFQSEVNKATGMTEVKVAKVAPDMKTPMNIVYEPGHDLADENGFVEYPNVTTQTESMDMRQASRMYEANMTAIESAREMMLRSIDMLR